MPLANPLVETICKLFAEVTGVEAVDPNDSFLDLGGDSLMAMQLVSRLRKQTGRDVPLGSLFETPTPAAIARALDRLLLSAAPPLTAGMGVDGDAVALSHGQARLWTMDRLVGPSAVYNLSVALRLEGPLNGEAMRAAFIDLVDRHAALRTIIRIVEGEPRGRLIADPEPRYVVESLESLAPGARETAVAAAIRSEAARPFDLSRDTLLRMRLLRLSAEAHVVALVGHHAAMDGVSSALLARDLGVAYAARLAGQAPVWPDLPVSYADFAAWMRARVESDPEIARQISFWRENLAGAPPLLELPTDRPRLVRRARRAERRPLQIEPELAAALGVVASRNRATLFAVLMAGYAAMLGRVTGRDDVVIGLLTAGRARAEIEDLVGFFVNTLPLRIDLSGQLGADALVARVRLAATKALDNQETPFELLVEALGAARSLDHGPLVQVAFAFQSFEPPILHLQGLDVAVMDAPPIAAKFDLALLLTPRAGHGIEGYLEYDADLFDAATIERWSGYFLRILASMPSGEGPGVELVDSMERARLLSEFNSTAADIPATTIGEMFEAQARLTPDAIAVSFAEQTLTYRELDLLSNRVASAVGARFAGAGDVVALALPRSLELAAALLGVAKAGAAYLPLDPTYPAERLAFMLRDSGARLAIVGDGCPQPDGVPVMRISAHGLEGFSSAPRRALAKPGDIATIAYTSGSTGRPKGVAGRHAAVCNRLLWMARRFPGAAGTPFFARSSVGFVDFSTELLSAFASGAQAVLFDEESGRDPALLARALGRHPAARLNGVPRLLRAVAEACERAGVSPTGIWTTSGEAAPENLASALALLTPGVTLLNRYGTTEATGGVVAELTPRDSVVIGRPIGNMRAYVLDAALRLTPIGVAGELYLAGVGLARGYHGQPDLTAERFIACPFANGERMYRTGDRAMWRPDGQLMFLGRADRQISVRGFRIEPAEVEAALLALPEVTGAVVVARELGGEPGLVAYLVGGASLDAAALRAALLERLPDYMIPRAFAHLSALPLTPNGKLDLAALPAPEVTGHGVQAPATADEALLCGLFAELTGARSVGVRDGFFSLGGHSLLAMRLVALIQARTGRALPLRAVFEHQTPRELGMALARAQMADGPELTPGRGRDGDAVALSHGQIRMWMLDRLTGAPATYNMAAELRLRGPLDVAALAQALADVVGHQAALRTCVIEENGGPVGRLLPPPGPGILAIEDLAATPAEGRAELAASIIAAEARRAFDLARDYMLRARLLRLGPADHALVISFHHIATDGVSAAIIGRGLERAYAARVAGAAPDFAELPVSYADYAVWQRETLARDGAAARRIAYWRERLEGAPDLLSLPTDSPRSPGRARRASHELVRLTPELTDALDALARRLGTTMFSVLLAGFAALLSRLARQTDIVIGTPVAGRARHEIEGLVGFFVNTLALRLDLAGSPSGDALIEQAGRVALEALAHQDTPFDYLIDALEIERSLDHAALLQVEFAWQNHGQPSLTLPGIDIEGRRAASSAAKFDLSLLLNPADDGGVEGRLEYDADLFSAPTIARWGGYLVRALQGMAARPDAAILALDILDNGERRLLLEGFNQTATPIPDGDVVDMFEARAALTPDAPAVHDLDGDSRIRASMSFAALDARANRLARVLRADHGIGPDAVAAILLPRSSGMLAAILATMKAGGAYLPLDAKFPGERVRWMLEDSAARVLITCKELAGAAPPGRPLLLLDDPVAAAGLDSLPPTRLAVSRAADDLAYIIYTSGSTGKPKGVAARQGGLRNYVAWCNACLNPAAGAGATVNLSIAFDATITAFFPPLVSGKPLWMIPDGREVGGLADLLRQKPDLGLIKIVPTLLKASSSLLMAEEKRGAARALVLGGEPVTTSAVIDWHRADPGVRIINHYGPTETVVGSIANLDVDMARESGPISVGKPIFNTRVYILDARLAPSPIGVPGELYIAGDGLARGYLNQPDLTADRFIACPFGPPGSRMYRTGDLAAWRADGRVDCLGRADHQVKIRGFRIEPGEIEAALTAIEGIGQAVALVREISGERRLVAYVTATRGGAPPSAANIRSALARTLPDYMVPSTFIVLDALPMTANGKLNGAALPEPEIVGAALADRVPSTTHEIMLCLLFEELTGAATVGVADGFFALGGHSLLAMRLLARIRQETGIDLPVRTIFEHQTPGELAALLDRDSHPNPYDPLLRLQRGERGQPLFCVHPSAGFATCYASLIDALGSEWPVWGLNARGMEAGEVPHASVAEMVDCYIASIRAVQPHGPYRLLGWSTGGMIAHAIARYLEGEGEQVEFVALLDTLATPPRAPAAPIDDELAELAQEIAETLGADAAKYTAMSEMAGDFTDIRGMRALEQIRVARRRLRAHEPGVCAAPLILFRASAHPPGNRPPDAFAWEALTRGGVRTFPIPCNHIGMLEPAHAGAIAEHLLSLRDIGGTVTRSPAIGVG